MARVTIEDLFASNTFQFAVELGDDRELEVTASDPKSAAVLVQYYEQKEDGKIGDEKAMLNLWRECRVNPTALTERFSDVPTAVKMGVTATLLEKLGEDAFLRQRSKLIEKALAKALNSQGGNGSSSKLQLSSESPQRPSVIEATQILSG